MVDYNYGRRSYLEGIFHFIHKGLEMFEKTNVELFNTVVLTQNISSSRVIQKSGFHFVGDIENG
jgi:hypothetical protein